MNGQKPASDFFHRSFWSEWRRVALGTVCLSLIVFLGVLRSATDAQFAFASLAFFPVIGIAWIEGRGSGLAVAFLAAIMWMISDIAVEEQTISSWIPWANLVTRLTIYSLLALLTDGLYLTFESEHQNATLDALTGIRNRMAFVKVGMTEVERAKRYGHPLTVIFLDLDNFKSLNDTRGHEFGDKALKATAETLVDAVRSTDFVARLGGDEFAILMPEIGYEAAINTGNKILACVNDTLGDFSPAKASAGLAWYESIESDFSEVLAAADLLMYTVKANGKNGMHSQCFRTQSAEKHRQIR